MHILISENCLIWQLFPWLQPSTLISIWAAWLLQRDFCLFLMRFHFASALSKCGPRLEVFCIANCIKAPFYHSFTQRTSLASIPEPFRQHAQEYVVGFSPSSVSIRFHSKGRQRVWRMINAFLRVTTENSPTELQLHTGLSRLLLSHHHLPCTPNTQRLLPPSYTFLLSTICFSPISFYHSSFESWRRTDGDVCSWPKIHPSTGRAFFAFSMVVGSMEYGGLGQ